MYVCVCDRVVWRCGGVEVHPLRVSVDYTRHAAGHLRRARFQAGQFTNRRRNGWYAWLVGAAAKGSARGGVLLAISGTALVCKCASIKCKREQESVPTCPHSPSPPLAFSRIRRTSSACGHLAQVNQVKSSQVTSCAKHSAIPMRAPPSSPPPHSPLLCLLANTSRRYTPTHAVDTHNGPVVGDRLQMHMPCRGDWGARMVEPKPAVVRCKSNVRAL